MTEELRPIIAGKYAIEWEIDAGAMGRVFAATQMGLERAVAIKIMSESGPEFRQRFLVEAHSLASLNHRNIVTIFDSGEMSNGLVFIVMEYLRGETLADAVKRVRRFDTVRALQVAMQVTRGLRAAHRQGIVHRDLKPSNIFLVEDDDEHEVVKIFDFGIAKTQPGTRNHVETRDGVIVGTPAYIAPEQVDGRPVDARADLYALGVVLYQMLSGRTPFIESSQVSLLLAHLRKEPPPLRILCPTLPASVEALVMKLLRKDPAARFRDADDLLASLKENLAALGGDSFRGQPTDVFEAATAGRPSTPRMPAPVTGLAPIIGVPLPTTAHDRRDDDIRTLEPLPRTWSPLPRTWSPSPHTPSPLPGVALLSEDERTAHERTARDLSARSAPPPLPPDETSRFVFDPRPEITSDTGDAARSTHRDGRAAVRRMAAACAVLVVCAVGSTLAAWHRDALVDAFATRALRTPFARASFAPPAPVPPAVARPAPPAARVEPAVAAVTFTPAPHAKAPPPRAAKPAATTTRAKKRGR